MKNLNKCICKDYLPYRDTITGIVAAMMPMDSCVNCHDIRCKLQNLKYSGFPMTVEGYTEFTEDYRNFETHLKHFQTGDKTRKFLTVHHKLGINYKYFTDEELAHRMVEYHTKEYEEVIKYLDNE